jgi:hypothetical protein
MKWITLKMHMLPVIFQEIDFVTEQYINLLNTIRKSNTNEVNFLRNNAKEKENKIKEFNELRENITKRINELEDFYEDNIEDIRVNNFEKARLRLKKLLMYDVDSINKIENSTNQINIFINNPEQSIAPLTEEKKKKIFENSLPNEKIAQIQAAQALVEAEKERMRQNEIKMNNQKKTSNNKNNVRVDKNKSSSMPKKYNKVDKINMESSYMKPLNKNRKSKNFDNSFSRNDIDFNLQNNYNNEKAIE